MGVEKEIQSVLGTRDEHNNRLIKTKDSRNNVYKESTKLEGTH